MDSAVSSPDVSVIIAAHNVENYVARSVRSALDQRSVSVEVIVIDDASTDGTVDAVVRIDDPRVRLLRRSQNGGPSAARNEGIAAVNAPWVAVLDGDDMFAPGRLARCLERAQKAEADIVVDNLEVRREADGATWPMFCVRDFGGKDTLDLEAFIRGNSSFLGGVSLGYLKPIFRTSFLREHRLVYDPDIRIGEDYLLLAEALACGACCAVENFCGYQYTVRAGSISHRLSVADVERMKEGDRKFMDKYALPVAALKAQEKRNLSLNRVWAFTVFVEAIKNRRVVIALKIALFNPMVILGLREAVWKRIQKLVGART